MQLRWVKVRLRSRGKVKGHRRRKEAATALQLSEGMDTIRMDWDAKFQGGRAGIGTFRKLFVAKKCCQARFCSISSSTTTIQVKQRAVVRPPGVRPHTQVGPEFFFRNLVHFENSKFG